MMFGYFLSTLLSLKLKLKGQTCFSSLGQDEFLHDGLIYLEWSEIFNFLNKQIQNIIWMKGTSKSLENNRSTVVFVTTCGIFNRQVAC